MSIYNKEFRDPRCQVCNRKIVKPLREKWRHLGTNEINCYDNVMGNLSIRPVEGHVAVLSPPRDNVYKGKEILG